MNDFLNRAILIASLALFDQITVLENPAGVEKKGSLVSAGDGFDRFEILQRHGMAAARVHAKLDVNARDFLSVLAENSLQFVKIDIARKELGGIEIVSIIADDVDHLAPVGLDMESCGGEKHIARNDAALFDVHLGPYPFRCPPLRDRNDVREAKQPMKMLCQRDKSLVALRRHLHT